jgi:hypothetical protein
VFTRQIYQRIGSSQNCRRPCVDQDSSRNQDAEAFEVLLGSWCKSQKTIRSLPSISTNQQQPTIQKPRLAEPRKWRTVFKRQVRDCRWKTLTPVLCHPKTCGKSLRGKGLKGVPHMSERQRTRRRVAQPCRQPVSQQRPRTRFVENASPCLVPSKIQSRPL